MTLPEVVLSVVVAVVSVVVAVVSVVLVVGAMNHKKWFVNVFLEIICNFHESDRFICVGRSYITVSGNDVFNAFEL